MRQLVLFFNLEDSLTTVGGSRTSHSLQRDGQWLKKRFLKTQPHPIQGLSDVVVDIVVNIEVLGCFLTWAREAGAATSRVMVRRWSEIPAIQRNPAWVDSNLVRDETSVPWRKYLQQQKELCHMTGSCKQNNFVKDLASIFAWPKEGWQAYLLGQERIDKTREDQKLGRTTPSDLPL